MKPEMIAELRDLGGRAQMRWIECANSWNAGDRADAYLYRLCQFFYERIADGADVETTLDRLDCDWRSYAKIENAKIEAAGKFKHGPYSGQSTRMASFVYPDKFGDKKIHLRNMVKILKKRFGE